MKMDLSKWKKIASDSKCTTMKHAEGHKIIIAHHALTPAMKKELKGISNKYSDKEEAEVKGYADGGGVEEESPGIWEAAKAAWNRQSAGGFGLPAPAPEGPAPASVAPPVVEAAPQAAPTLAPAPAPAPPAAPSLAGLAGGINAGLAQEKAGAQKFAQAAEQEGMAATKAADEQMQAVQRFQQESEKRFAALQAERQAILKDFNAGHINPNHYVESQSSGQKVQTAIGIMLGAIGSAFTGGENPGMAWLNKQIERDIEAQKQELGKRQTLLSANLQEFGNLKDALDMTRIQMNDLYSAKVAKAAAGAAGPKAKAQAEMYIGQKSMESMQLLGTLSSKLAEAGLSGVAGSGPLAKINALPKELRDNALKEYADYKTLQGSIGEIDRIMNEFSKVSTADRFNPLTADKAGQAEAALVGIAKTYLGEAMQEADVKRLVKPFVPGILSNNQASRDKSASGLKQMLLSKSAGKMPILTELGIVAPVQAPAEVKSMGGVKYQKVPGGWQKVK